MTLNLDVIFDRNEESTRLVNDLGDGKPMPTVLRDHFHYDVPDLIREVVRLRERLTTASGRVRHIAEHGDPAAANALNAIADQIAEDAR